MFLVDTNVWLALALSKHSFHIVVRKWLDSVSQRKSVAFCRATQQSFLRLLTTKAVLSPYGIPPLNNKSAWSVYEGFFNDKRISLLDEPKGLEAQWKQLAHVSKASPKLWMDAYLAAFAITGRYQIVTTDLAFRQFKGLQVQVLSIHPEEFGAG